MNKHSFTLTERNTEPEKEPQTDGQEDAPPVNNDLPMRPVRTRRPPDRLGTNR